VLLRSSQVVWQGLLTVHSTHTVHSKSAPTGHLHHTPEHLPLGPSKACVLVAIDYTCKMTQAPWFPFMMQLQLQLGCCTCMYICTSSCSQGRRHTCRTCQASTVNYCLLPVGTAVACEIAAADRLHPYRCEGIDCCVPIIPGLQRKYVGST
jgi:hypothetical protein